MRTLNTVLRLLVAALVLVGCSVEVGQPAPTSTPLRWAELEEVVVEATAAAGAAFGARWRELPIHEGEAACALADGSGAASAGTRAVWSGWLPAGEEEGKAGMILRERFQKPWQRLGLTARYEKPDSPRAGGRVVATIDGSQQLVVTGALADGHWNLDARVACYTAGLPEGRRPADVPRDGAGQ
jgi:hypothetical protein